MPEAAPGEGLLSVEGVRVTRGRQVVLRGIDLVIQRGAPFAIAGESGSGKTTLLFVIAGLLRPDAGAVTVGGEALDGLSPRDRARRIGIVFQDHQLFPHLTVIENVCLAPGLHGRKGVEDAARSLLGELGLDGFDGRRPHELSGGQKQRVAIARSLVLEPSVVLFDEPSSALDPRTSRDLADLLSRLSDRLQVVVVSHDRPFVERCCPRGVRLDAGKVGVAGAPGEIFA